MNKNYFLLLVIINVQTYSCKKSTMDNSIQHTGPDVYVAGSWNGLGVYWKNDSAVFLGGNDLVGIYVSGNDVYVAGSANVAAAAYWKNDSLVRMPDGSTPVFVNSMFVSGNDVYLAGVEYVVFPDLGGL
jgi:hypothetical protein